MTPLVSGNELIEKYLAIRELTTSLCTPLSPEDMTVQPITDVSPPKWHMGHTTWFFEELILKDFAPDYKEFDPSFAWLFNSYYETKGDRLIRAERGNMTRPGVDRILAYRQWVDMAVVDFIQHGLSTDLVYLFNLGLHHEQQHQELLCYDIQYILGHNPLFPIHSAADEAGSRPIGSLKWLSLSEGIYESGASPDGFAYDNEYTRHKVYLHDFSIASRCVTNGEYLEFIEAGAYTDHRYWLMEGFEWVKENSITAPEYWFKNEDGWFRYCMHGLEALTADEPLSHVSYYEADAYARWKECRLPTEHEWEAACSQYQNEIPDPANMLHAGKLRTLINDTENPGFFGGVWEWTNSAYLPYPGFKIADGAVGEYNGKFMISQMVLKGGSWATPRDHIRKSYRNFFHPDKRWQVAGIRLVKDD